MIKNFLFTVIAFFCIASLYSQRDSLNIGDKYWEDQLYLNISYNVLTKQPATLKSSTFSYGLSAGYIKDIPFTRKGNFAFGVGVGYNFDFINNDLKITSFDDSDNIYSKTNNATTNTMQLHNIELPFQFRWRTSTAKTYSFWRVYTGVNLSYNLSNSFTNIENGLTTKRSNVNEFNKWQLAATLSAGYSTFNVFVSYGLTPMFKNAKLQSNNEQISAKMLKLGISFFFL